MSDFFSEYRKHEDIIKERIKKAPTKELLPFFNGIMQTASNAKNGVNRLSNDDLINLSDYLMVTSDYFLHFVKMQNNLSKWIEEEDYSQRFGYLLTILKFSRKTLNLRVKKPSSWKLEELELIYNSIKNSFYQIFIAQD